MLPWMTVVVQLYTGLRKSAQLVAVLPVPWFKRLKLRYSNIHDYKKQG